MKKSYLLIITAIIFTLLCGCGKFGITCSIDKWNNAEMRVDIKIPKSGMTEEEKDSFKYVTSGLYDYWEGLGYIVDFAFAGNTYDITLKKRTLVKSREAALNVLLEMMGSDSSPFSFVEGGYSGSYFSDIYNIKAEIDLAKIVDYEYIDTLPPSQKNKILNGLGQFEGTVTFDLPGEVVSHEGDISSGKNTVSLRLNETAGIYSVMEVQNTENRESYDTLLAEIARLEKEKRQYMLAVAAAGAALFVIAAVSVILIIRHKRKKTGNI